MNNNLPIKKEDGNIFTKIKTFFKTVFKLNNNVPNYNYAVEQGDVISIKNNDFASPIRIEENNEEKELLQLQEKFEQGLIQEEDLSQEQVDKLEQLYNKQIEELNEKFLDYKDKIISIKKKLE